MTLHDISNGKFAYCRFSVGKPQGNFVSPVVILSYDMLGPGPDIRAILNTLPKFVDVMSLDSLRQGSGD